jgi:hypothetical protein
MITETNGAPEAVEELKPVKPEAPKMPREIGGVKGPEPARYGDWEHKGRCTDF